MRTWNGYTAVLIDLDGTLVSEPNTADIVDMTAETLATRHRNLRPADLVDANRHVVQIWADERHRRTAAPAHRRTPGDYWRATLLLCGRTDEALAREAAEEFARFESQARRLLPGAVRLLSEIQSSGTPTVLVSNGRTAEQRQKLQASGIASLLTHVVVSEDVGARKPDARVFQYAMGLLGEPQRHRPCHIGNSLQSDVAGAVACGIEAIWLNPHGAPIGPECPRPSVEAREILQICGTWADDVVRHL